MRAGIEIAAWWLAGFVVWTATLASASGPELVTGVLASLVSAVLARTARRAMGGQPGLSRQMWARWVRWAALVPVAAAADLARLVGWLAGGLREPGASARTHQLTVPSGSGPEAITWRQGAALAVSSTPGSVVIGIRPDDGTLVLDQLVSGWPGLDERVADRQVSP
ncbi:hypothetical protein GCM10011575_07920 [Microlunatus endophyticus]|uniref:Na+/H+ ion antiporter subunit n=1 Tax=Microlunatus endophyticus TaxID=1716077 RepID=A0A917W208_9ACTN|nr:hypothetical protein [Microlunatus endophyticus]GGL52093.1 hypothetical protein GCM10011575_07920 [Microlunatus endophyticus]